MAERTLIEALAHAEKCRGGYVDLRFPEDLALLADEVKRLQEGHRNSELQLRAKCDEIARLQDELECVKEAHCDHGIPLVEPCSDCVSEGVA